MQTIDENSAGLESVKDWFELTYVTMITVRSTETKEARSRLWTESQLVSKVTQARDLAVLFSADRYAEKALGFFTTAAAFHLVLLQQQALTDNEELDPESSIYKSVWSKWASRHADKGRDTLKRLFTERVAKLQTWKRSYKRSGKSYTNGFSIGKPQHYYIRDWYEAWTSNEVVVNNEHELINWGSKKLIVEQCRPRARHLFNDFKAKFQKSIDAFNKWDGKNLNLVLKFEEVFKFRFTSEPKVTANCGYVVFE